MARKRYSDADILRLLREIEVHLSGGLDVASVCRKAGFSDATDYIWRKKFGGMGRSQLTELRSLQKENDRLKKIVAKLELDKLMLKESLDIFKPLVEESGVLFLTSKIYSSNLVPTPTDRLRLGFGRSNLDEGLAALDAHLLRNLR